MWAVTVSGMHAYSTSAARPLHGSYAHFDKKNFSFSTAAAFRTRIVALIRFHSEKPMVHAVRPCTQATRPEQAP